MSRLTKNERIMNKIVQKIREVAAAIILEDDKILLGRRKPGESLAGYWEFPGGKVEADETIQECLERELREELSLETRAGEILIDNEYHYEHGSFRIIAVETEVLSGTMKMNVHDKLEWVPLEELTTYKLPPADIPIVEKLIELHLGENRFTADANKLNRRIMLFAREQFGKQAGLWQDRPPITPEERISILESEEYNAWNDSKRDFAEEEFSDQTWIKTCPHGHITELEFCSDNTIRETTVFDRAKTTGHWKLINGVIRVTIYTEKHEYELDVIANRESSIHSAIEFESGYLHTYLKIFQLK